MKKNSIVVETYTCEKCQEEFNNEEVAKKHEDDCTIHLDEPVLGNWKKYIGAIPSDRLLYLIFNNGSSNQRCTYWNRWYAPKSVSASGSVPYSSKDSSADSSANIFSLYVNRDHLIHLYNSKETSIVEKNFIKHYTFVYILMGIDYRHNRFHSNFAYNLKFLYDPDLNGTNMRGRAMENIFQLYYIMQRMGASWKTIIESTKIWVKDNDHYMSKFETIKRCINRAEGRDLEMIKDFWEVPTCGEPTGESDVKITHKKEGDKLVIEKVETSLDEFVDKFIDAWFGKLIGAHMKSDYAGTQELGGSYVDVLSATTLYVEDLKRKVKLTTGEKIVKKVWVDYRLSTIIYIDSPPWFEEKYQTPSTKSRTCKCMIETTSRPEELEEGDWVIDVEDEGGVMRAWNTPYKFSKKKYKARVKAEKDGDKWANQYDIHKIIKPKEPNTKY